MTKEESKIVYQDLSMRLAYNVKVRIDDDGGIYICALDEQTLGFIEPWDIHPYLRPIQSMTESEKKEFEELWEVLWSDAMDKSMEYMLNKHSIGNEHEILACSKVVDWLNAHHFDHHGLIEKGLAVEAPEEMYFNMNCASVESKRKS